MVKLSEYALMEANRSAPLPPVSQLSLATLLPVRL